MTNATELTISNIPKFIVLNLIHWVSFLSIRDRNVWVFGSWDGSSFLDNSKYLYLAAQRCTTVKPVWISNNVKIVKSLRERGYPAYCSWQIQAIFYGLRAKYYFIDHAPLYGGLFSPTNLWVSGGAKIIQLWHGLPLKRLDNSGLRRLQKRRSTLVSVLSKLSLFNLSINYYVVACSHQFGKLIAQSFEMPQNKVLYSCYPRNLFKRIPEKISFSLQQEVNNKVKQLKAEGKKLVFYIPTFRDYGGNPIKDKAIDVEALRNYCRNNQCVFLIKFHEVDGNKLQDGEDVIFLPSGFDLYEILHLVDVLVTDYSSIFFDFLEFNRPIVFYPYDLAKYESSARCFYFNYKPYVPGSIVDTFDELLNSLSTILKIGNDGYSEKRLKLHQSCFEYQNLMLANILVDY